MSTYNRPGRGVYVTNGETELDHGQPVASDNYVGCAVKQKGYDWTVAVANADKIGKKEDYFIITKGVVEVLIGEIKAEELTTGTAVYIKENKITLKAEGATKFGRVHDAPGERGTPATMVRVDLDQKATL